MKHAFLVIAHNEFVLKYMLNALDHEYVDIFVHFDKKVKDLPKLSTNKSRLYVLSERIDTRWGDFSQIETEMVLMAAASKVEHYLFYHIISGTHLPLKPITTILNYYNKLAGKNVFHHLNEGAQNQNILKIRRWNLFTKSYAYGAHWKRRLYQILNERCIRLQAFWNIYRNKDLKLYQAANWVSLSDEAVRYILSNEKEINQLFKYTFCGDEYFVPTILMASSLKDTLISPKNILFQDMGAANARTLTLADCDDIINSDCLWARKFSMQEDKLVHLIHQHICMSHEQ